MKNFNFIITVLRWDGISSNVNIVPDLQGNPTTTATDVPDPTFDNCE